MGCLPFPASCAGLCGCTCYLYVSLTENAEDACKVDAIVQLIRNCDGALTELNLDDYGVMARVTGDDGVLWEGLASELPAKFTATVSDTFELYAWASDPPLGYGGYGGLCVDIPAETISLTIYPSCKTCPVAPDCECLDGDFKPIRDAVITLSGSPIVIPYTESFGGAIGTCTGTLDEECGDLSGSYVVPCDGLVHIAGITKLICVSEFTGTYFYYVNYMKYAQSGMVGASGGSPVFELWSGYYAYVWLGSGDPPIIVDTIVFDSDVYLPATRARYQRMVLYQDIPESFLCTTPGELHYIRGCKIVENVTFIPETLDPAFKGGCDLRGMTFSVDYL